MAATPEQARALELAQDATKHIAVGDFAQAGRSLREASSIAPEDPAIKAIWQNLKVEESRSAVLKACRKWLKTKNEDDGEAALDVLHHTQFTDDVAKEAMEVLVEFAGEDDMADQLTAELLKHRGARRLLASRFSGKPHFVWMRLWERGDDSVDALTTMLLDPESWPSEKARIAAERDVFQLALAMLMAAGLDHPDRAMKAISRLLAAEASHLHGLIDADGFDVILSCLDIRLPNTLRSQATLATAKLMELSPDTGRKLIKSFVTSRFLKPTTESLIVACSASAAMFPLAPPAAAKLFLTDGFAGQLVHLVKGHKSTRLEQAALELLSAACIDKACREAISTMCKDWLQGIVDSGTDKRRSNLAALILVKLSDAKPDNGGTEQKVSEVGKDDQAELVQRFKSMVLESGGSGIQDSVEGLAYASLRPEVMEELVNDSAFLRELITALQDPASGPSLAFGGLTILSNVTAYRPTLSEEQKKMSQLKAYANASKPQAADPLDDDAHVTARCQKVLNAGVVPLLVFYSRRVSPNLQNLIFQILVSISKEPKHRGLMAQQGAAKLLLQLTEPPSSKPTPTPEDAAPTSSSTRTAAHALARILISVNPAHLFTTSAALPITSAIRLLSTLLTPDPTTEQRDLLPLFEGLLALTNLASHDDPARTAILRLAFPALEDLLLSSHTFIQRAAVELVCNLMASPEGVAKFADGSKQAIQRLHVLLALADAEDLATRRAAGGALAMLTEWDQAVEAVLARERGVEILLGLCGEENEECVHRGVVCVGNLVSAPEEVGVRAREKVKAEGGVEILRELLGKTKNQEILRAGVEALKALA
ncbi:hypothetical protein W97_00544 [Coniosporium apollinis CBS 100218]|uniref:UNC-45/Cro1/She4 central domain-containing protein n=1 Tax=Coniosporium apollinis (strain CBS 100218) TaxID=1168221 RepID=R7YI51_CONA1|nr:uncharacterized protein W97_00544 [Coniosporium apollinis CBS 100218]EON61331.1 hypothetical protein W97_00544 [Coniosporium apollinis CBS 100218]